MFFEWLLLIGVLILAVGGIVDGRCVVDFLLLLLSLCCALLVVLGVFDWFGLLLFGLVVGCVKLCGLLAMITFEFSL